MSEKVENEIEEKEEREMFDHWYHEHPLTLVEARGRGTCYGCLRYFIRGEKCYVCSQECGYGVQLHEDCAEAPRNIRHAMHPQHTLTQQFSLYRVGGGRCSICQRSALGVFYTCADAECSFVTHIRCAQGSDMMYPAEDGEKQQSSSGGISHPSHPKHGLRFLKRSCSFKCDACGTAHAKGSSYLCNRDDCEYWIHERCASLPQNIQREDHHHSLSLSFHVAPQYLRYDYHCDVCIKGLHSKQWIYHCELCSYVVHLSCAFDKSLLTTREKGIMEFPMSDVAVGEDLIGAFLRRQGVDAHAHSLILDHQDDVDYKFHNHKLKLVSSSLSSFQEQKEENSDVYDDDEEDYSSRKSELICNGCITPILVKQTSLSSSSSSSSCSGSSSSSKDNNYYYMRCSISSCKYYLHLACFLLPTQLSSLPLLHKHERDYCSLVLRSADKLKPWEWSFCLVCRKDTNGLYYACTKCNGFRVDIKCASMPDTIYHAAHPPHPLNFRSAQHTLKRQGLPASTTSLKWDKHHPLLLTHDATLNRPGDFYCNQCEQEMHPKHWMYHCRSCDISIHPRCFLTTSGEYKNIKLGQEYDVKAETHPHPLTFQLLTTKRRCDICGKDRHEETGFYCAFCNFFICLNFCGEKIIRDGNIEAVD
ncbi:uncharacterized protein LOC125205010 isoform X2 [Salvia hispanica]|uniref:uncharacterized protein LOC125205010 isoform X2 n=1 Tax=Salvia hispanica TaxID=49212 RepID=UPI002008FDA5|nr:uncharacterized protein LOC125205010 isoform X2 [Salvia hispanica]